MKLNLTHVHTGDAATAIGYGAYAFCLTRINYRIVVYVGTGLACLFGLTQLVLVLGINRKLGIPDIIFAVGDAAVIKLVGGLIAAPLMVVAVRLCPKGVEGTLYAFLMSSVNLGLALANVFGGLIMSALGITKSDFTQMWVLVVIVNVLRLLPLILVPFLLPRSDKETLQGQTRILERKNSTQKIE
jgi:hypothetical protein